MSIFFREDKIIINSLGSIVTIYLKELDHIIVNNERKFDSVYFALNAINWGGIENLFRHHEYNITKIVAKHNGDVETIKLEKGVLHSLLGPAYVSGDEIHYYIKGRSLSKEEYHKNPEVVTALRENKLKRILDEE